MWPVPQPGLTLRKDPDGHPSPIDPSEASPAHPPTGISTYSAQ